MTSTRGPVPRVAVLGDLGGHSHALRNALVRLGVRFDLARDHRPTGHEWADVSWDWPDDLHVISVGDLIHRGPDSLGVVVLVDRLLRAGTWTQLAGNHEQVYVDRPVFEWNERIPEPGITLLRDWWDNGLMGMAAAVLPATGGPGHLVTHAGLTHGFWDRVLNRPATAADAAAAIVETVADGAVWLPGSMLGYRHNLCAGPAWAECGPELVASWMLAETYHPLPFDQVHGHSTPYHWGLRQWRVEGDLRDRFTLDHGRRHSVASIGEHTITGIDPGHGKQAAPMMAPLLLPDTQVITPPLP